MFSTLIVIKNPLLNLLTKSLHQGTVPTSLKKKKNCGVSLLKKQGDNPVVLKNYRPTSWLPYPVNMLEAYMASAISVHLQISNFLQPLRVWSCSAHSTECVILSAVDELRNGWWAWPSLCSGVAWPICVLYPFGQNFMVDRDRGHWSSRRYLELD